MGKKHKGTICFDFDGVIHSYTSGWKGETVISDPPVPGIRETIKTLKEDGYEIVIFTSRASSRLGREAVELYLLAKDIPFNLVTAIKPPAKVLVDDRAINFNGDVTGLIEKIINFRSWVEPPRYSKVVSGVYFREAIKYVEQQTLHRYGMRLQHWDKDKFVQMYFPCDDVEMTEPFLYVESRFGTVPWKPTLSEIVSDQWVVNPEMSNGCGNIFRDMMLDNHPQRYMRLPIWKPDVKIRKWTPGDNPNIISHSYLYVRTRNTKMPWHETFVELLTNSWDVIIID